MTEAGRYAFLHSIGLCCISGRGPIEVAHVRMSDSYFGKVNPGMGEKPHWVWTVPLAMEVHRLQHAMGERKFWREHGFTLDPLDSPLTIALALEGFRTLGDVDGARRWISLISRGNTASDRR